MQDEGRTDASRVTLGRHVIEMQRQHPGARGELSVLLLQLAFAGKIFSHALRRAAFADRLGSTGGHNVQGEATKKLDDFGNDVILEAFARTELVSAIVSEEMDEPRHLAGGSHASYVLCVDPLDGSSNSDVNGAVATIFGIYRPSGPAGAARVQDLRNGRDQVAAGYIMYGPSTMLVYTTGAGVHGFTLDHDLGEFVLTHPAMMCPSRGPYYSANIGKAAQWDPAVRAYVDALTSDRDKPHSLRYTGAFVADLHRCLIDGGVYFYPADGEYRDGKLRLAYECAPMAFVIEQAGGAATTGSARVMDVPMETPHQRVPLAIGSRAEVELYERFSRGEQ
ncbi:class 1 fructose-bisphosphatase [soil metagenome]|nr:class 1 fructose-bisphosphatase [Acidobacteriota bacterium]